MTWTKTCEKKYNTTGMKKPVFLWDDLGKKRVFVDIPKDTKAEIQYSYDNLNMNEENNANVKWHEYETGIIEGDFAFEVIGITALRLHIKGNQNSLVQEGVNLDIYEHKQSINNMEKCND